MSGWVRPLSASKRYAPDESGVGAVLLHHDIHDLLGHDDDLDDLLAIDVFG